MTRLNIRNAISIKTFRKRVPTKVDPQVRNPIGLGHHTDDNVNITEECKPWYVVFDNYVEGKMCAGLKD